MINLLMLVLLSTTILSSACETNSALTPNKTPSSEESNIAQVRSFAFIGPNNAWLVDSRSGQLWRTTDDGRSWDKVSGDKVGGRFWAVTFIDSQRGWAANFEGRIWRTSDGGTNWTLISQPKGGEDNQPPFLPHQFSFVDETHGWLIDAFAIWRTDDGGTTWIHTLSLMTKVEDHIWQPTRISFINRNVGWMSATGGIVHRTKDGGWTWQSRKLIPGESDATDVLFIDHIGWLTGFVSSTEPQSGTRLYRTDDGGETWQLVPLVDNDTYVNSVWFANEKRGWAVGRASRMNERNRGIILRTDDGGKTWKENMVGQNEEFFDRMYFVDSEHGWLFAENNIYRTQDGGKSWTSVLKIVPMRITTD
jgi:photosystem II stability/assembly factor-like uncharacterized protein